MTLTDIPAIDIPAIDEANLERFVGQAVVDMGAAISGLLLHLGDRLGLYKAMAGSGPITSDVLAERTGTAERYVREWLGNQAAGGYVIYDPADARSAAGRARHGSGERGQPGLPRRAPSRPSRPATPTTSWLSQAFRTGDGHRLARARRPAVLRSRAAVPPRLRRPPRRRVAAGPGRGGREARDPGRAWPTWAAGSARPR